MQAGQLIFPGKNFRESVLMFMEQNEERTRDIVGEWLIFQLKNGMMPSITLYPPLVLEDLERKANEGKISGLR